LLSASTKIEHGFGEITDSTARQTLYRILESRNNSANEFYDVYVQDYICGCVYEAINRAGKRIHYYHIDESFYQNFDYKTLVSTIKKESDCKKTVLIFVNYFATFDCVRTVKIIKELDKDLTVIIYNVQSFFDMRIDSCADYQFTSLRKWFPVPDGSAVNGNKEHELKPIELVQSTSAVEGIIAGFLKNYKSFSEVRDNDYLTHFEKAEEIINSSWNVKVSSFTETILDTIDFDIVALQRRNNAYSLCEAIIRNRSYKVSAERIIKLLDERSAMVPMFVSVFMDNRDYVRHVLMNNNIFCPVHWPDAKNKDLAVCELSLVIDQRYDENDMKKIADILNRI